MFGARKYSAKNPSTIVGMPAIVSRTGLTMFADPRARVLGEAGPPRARPSGIAMTIAMTAIEQRAR